MCADDLLSLEDGDANGAEEQGRNGWSRIYGRGRSMVHWAAPKVLTRILCLAGFAVWPEKQGNVSPSPVPGPFRLPFQLAQHVAGV